MLQCRLTPQLYVSGAKLADFITIQVKIVAASSFGFLLKNTQRGKEKRRRGRGGVSAQGEAGAKGLTVASRDARPSLAANPRGI